MDFTARILSLALAAGFGLIGLQGLARYWASSDALRIANLIDQGKPTSEDLLDRVESTGAVRTAMASCLDDLGRAGVSISLRRLEQAILAIRETQARAAAATAPATQPSAVEAIGRLSRRDAIDAAARAVPPMDPAEIAARGRAAEDVVTARLTCTPTDGNAWLQRALLLDLRLAPAEEVHSALMRSYWLAPAEGWILDMRARFVASRVEAGDDELASALSGDLLKIAEHYAPRDIAAFYVAAGPKTRALLATHIRRQPDREPTRRRRAIIAQIDMLGVTFR
ncbi:hypothetical protein [Bosea sp. (in: a-proteobacteria)]|uniref:hypothetical protein n=1 Tax=Bosea sp. (in: a-proteobacteria) TaxID=1871050 RepID=UPI002633752C|nr:hypothetical protein [Bosea sp. (in: a-proteobacteria)]MCO5091019.1 hypothetical protein [Bosea sp. (in: a-proteobacteria)]